ncbi:MAG: hypothetical protein RBT51_08735 [Ectothiorhodospiraceae bacterium]|nr:hypothetical protein [Ectothiorhodospiraceae bacterium]
MMLHRALGEFAAQGGRIRVGIIGAGFMGRGIAAQVAGTPGMAVAFIADRVERRATGAADHLVALGHPRPATGGDGIGLLETHDIDLLVEATTGIGAGLAHCRAAFRQHAHVVLMNAEVDLACGDLLAREAAAAGVVVTSDAGDQPGVLARLIDEMRLFGLRLVMAGNIKGFLDRHATAAGLHHEAAIRDLDPVQCCAYTDGTKLNIEMALVANAFDLRPLCTGMQGPHANTAAEALTRFRLTEIPQRGCVDYLLGAEPGGGVFAIGHSDDPSVQRYLRYLKLGDGPFYLLLRPHHLCHFETPLAVAAAALERKPLLQPWAGRVTDVYAHAKRDLKAGAVIDVAIGGDLCHGLIEDVATARQAGWVPLTLLEPEADAQPDERARLRRSVAQGAPLTWDDVEIPDTPLNRLLRPD